MELLNTLFVTTQNAYLHLDHDTVRVEVERRTALRVPLLHLEALVCFGNVLVSTGLIHRCGEDGRAIVFLGRSGRFKARIVGPTGGNVLLRRAQHEACSDSEHCLRLARNMVAGKIHNARHLLLRSAREAREPGNSETLRKSSDALAILLSELATCRNLDGVRGHEGEAARQYFAAFNAMVRQGKDYFRMDVRTRRPPRDALNATLSFVYSLVLNECISALESVGLDPQMGYLHALRPGKPALALDLMEEFRPALGDRLALTLINRRQLTEKSFEAQAGGAVYLNDAGRRTVLEAYQKRKAEVLRHQILDRAVPLGLMPHVQARLLARYLRGDLQQYPPFVAR